MGENSSGRAQGAVAVTEPSEWTGITGGTFAVSVGGAAREITGLDFSGETNLNGVAGVTGGGECRASCTGRANASS